MRFQVRAVTPEDYAAWIASTKASGPRLDRAAYDDLAKPSKDVAPSTYSDVEQGLFDRIVSGSGSAMELGAHRSMEGMP
jgi:cytochrome o ubiquinol oxidase subunit 2